MGKLAKFVAFADMRPNHITYGAKALVERIGKGTAWWCCWLGKSVHEQDELRE
jgi:hypothetical protein